MLRNDYPESNIQTMVWNFVEAVGLILEAQGGYVDIVYGLVNLVHCDMLKARNGFDILKGGLNCNMKKV